ncbi:hypothetical protein [Vibrio phage J14]|nr:hypothetical protein [Vibrio phage J14]
MKRLKCMVHLKANDRPQPISDQKRAKARKKRKKAQRAARGRK